MGQVFNIAVVGCGIGGLAAACLLREQGHAVTVFEQFRAPRPIGSGLIVQPVGQAVLGRLGVLAEARAHGVAITAMQGVSLPGERVALQADYGAGRSGLSLHRGALFNLLHAAAVARRVEIVTDSFVLDADQLGGKPYLRIEGGRQAGPFDLVVDAAGAGSPVSPLVARPLRYGALWGVVDLPAGETDLGGVLRQRYVAARRMAGVLPIGRLPGDPVPKAALFWSLRTADFPDWAGTDIADWREEAAAMWPEFGVLAEGIRSHGDLTFAAYCHGSLFAPWTGHVIHIGDAGHQASPQLGQGANMALLDAAALAAALEPGLTGLRRRFAARRFLHVRVYQAMSALFTPLYQSDYALMGRLRDDVLMPLATRGPMPRAIGRLLAGDLVAPMGWGPMPRPVEQVAGALHEPGE